MINIKDNSTSVTYSNPTLQNVLDYLYNPPSGHSTMIQTLLTAAFQKAESVIGRSLAVHTYQLEVDEHDGEIYLLNSPIGTISKVEYYDGSTWNELTHSEYEVFGLIEKTVSVSTVYQRIRITYATTAYSNAVIAKLIMDLVQVWYDNRPDADDLEQVIVNKMAKFKIWQVE